MRWITDSVVILALVKTRSAQLYSNASYPYEANVKNFPYVLSLEFMLFHICGATLIKPNVALTAAHCTYHSHKENSETFFAVRAGSQYSFTGGEVIQTHKPLEHPLYNYLNFPHDYNVAVLVLEHDSKLGEPAQLPRRDFRLPEGGRIVLLGWGRTTEAIPWVEKILKVELSAMNLGNCKMAFQDLILNDRTLCASLKQKPVCKGNSGGPGIYNDIQVGIHTWETGCTFAGQPTHLVRLAEPAIHDHITKTLMSLKN